MKLNDLERHRLNKLYQTLTFEDRVLILDTIRNSERLFNVRLLDIITWEEDGELFVGHSLEPFIPDEICVLDVSSQIKEQLLSDFGTDVFGVFITIDTESDIESLKYVSVGHTSSEIFENLNKEVIMYFMRYKGISNNKDLETYLSDLYSHTREDKDLLDILADKLMHKDGPKCLICGCTVFEKIGERECSDQLNLHSFCCARCEEVYDVATDKQDNTIINSVSSSMRQIGSTYLFW